MWSCLSFLKFSLVKSVRVTLTHKLCFAPWLRFPTAFAALMAAGAPHLEFAPFHTQPRRSYQSAASMSEMYRNVQYRFPDLNDAGSTVTLNRSECPAFTSSGAEPALLDVLSPSRAATVGVCQAAVFRRLRRTFVHSQ